MYNICYGNDCIIIKIPFCYILRNRSTVARPKKKSAIVDCLMANQLSNIYIDEFRNLNNPSLFVVGLLLLLQLLFALEIGCTLYIYNRLLHCRTR